MNVTSFETWMNFNQVLQTEDAMKIVFIGFKFVNVCKFLLCIASWKLERIIAQKRKFFTYLLIMFGFIIHQKAIHTAGRWVCYLSGKWRAGTAHVHVKANGACWQDHGVIAIGGLGKICLHFQVNAFANVIHTQLVSLATSKEAQSFSSVTKLFHFPLFSGFKKCIPYC